MFRAVPIALITCVAASALADGLPAGRGVVAPSGSVFTSEITPAVIPGDSDDYVVTGFAGTQLTAVVKVGRRGTLVPIVEILRPDGSTVTADDGLVLGGPARAPSAKFTLDATGTWKVRVRGKDASTGAYSVTVKTTKPVRTPVVIPVNEPDADGRYRFRVPAGPGATIGWDLRSSGDVLSFRSLADSHGHVFADVAGGTFVRAFVVPAGSPFGDYTVTFDAPAGAGPRLLWRTLVPGKGAKKRVARLSGDEPVMITGSIEPTSGVVGMRIAVRAVSLADPLARRGRPGFLLGDVALDDVTLDPDGTTLRGTIPLGLANGVYDVVATSASGQPAVAPGAFEVVSRPVVTGFDPPFGAAFGGFDITVSGTGFRAASGLLFDGVLQPVTPSYADATTLRFRAPQHAQGLVTVGVRDLGTGVDSILQEPRFEYVTTPLIGRVSPPLVPILSTEDVTLDGVYFFPDDKVFVETTTAGVFEDVTESQTTYVDFNHHRFAAPLRPKGEYQVYVEDAQGRPVVRRPKTLIYFSIVDATAASGLAGGPEAWDAVTSALADVDGDDDLDLVLSRRGDVAAAATPETRVLHNDGHGAFTDATASVMPAVTDDDWRADRVVAADIDGDGFADLVLATNSLTVPPAGRSHTRFLMNETRGGTAANAADRVFRDRTLDVMAPVRTMTKYPPWGASYATYVSDDWRGLDLWVGDLDTASSGPPSIVLTHDEVKDDDNPSSDVFNGGVTCGSYCASPYAIVYPYAMYWGGSRAFVWDKSARGGLGRFKFDANFFPRKSALTFRLGGAPGAYFPVCSPHYNSVCKSTFTPFTGSRLAVGDLDADGRSDVAVLANHPVERRFSVNGPMTPISSLQVALRGFNKLDGALVTDVTSRLTALGLDLSGDAVAIGRTGYPDGNAFGTVAVARSQAQAGSSLSLLRFSSSGGVVSVADDTAAALPPVSAGDSFQAADLRFADVDRDGAQDLVLLAPQAPSGGGSAFRILRNAEAGGLRGVFSRSFDTATDPLASSGDAARGDAVAIGDVSGDGLDDFVISRTVASAPGSGIRILEIDK